MHKTKKSTSLFKNTSVYLFSSLFSFLIPILLLPVYTRFLSLSDFGIIILFTMFGGLVSNFISLNLYFSSYLFYFKLKKDPENYKTLNSTNFIANCVIFSIAAIFLYFSIDWISTYIFENQLTKKLILLSFLSGCFGYFILYLNTLLIVQGLAISSTIMTISLILLDASLTLYFIFGKSLTFMARVYSIPISQGIIAIVLFVLNRKLFVLRFSLKHLKESLKISSPLILNSGIGVIQDSFDKTMLNQLTGIISVGYFSFGTKFAAGVKMISDSVDKSFNPFFLESANRKTEKGKEDIVNMFYKVAFFVICIGLCVIYFSEELIIILTTKEFYPSMYITPIFVWYYLIGVMAKISMNQISFSEKTAYILPGTTVMVLINVILNILLIPKHGAIGAAFATAISALFSQSILYFFGRKLYPLPLKIKKILILYTYLLGLTILIYPIMFLEINFFFKIGIKILIITLFVFSGIRLEFISQSDILLLLKKINIRSK